MAPEGNLGAKYESVEVELRTLGLDKLSKVGVGGRAHSGLSKENRISGHRDWRPKAAEAMTRLRGERRVSTVPRDRVCGGPSRWAMTGL